MHTQSLKCLTLVNDAKMYRGTVGNRKILHNVIWTVQVMFCRLCSPEVAFQKQ